MSQNQNPVSRRHFLKITSATTAGLYLSADGFSEPNTPSPDVSTVSFGLATDVHYCDHDPEGNRYFRQSIQKISECIDDFNQEDLSFVIQMGDLVDREINSFDKILSVCQRFQPSLYHVLGNHDFDIDDKYKENVHERLGLSSKYYDFVKGPWRFIVLDGNDLSIAAYAEGSERYKVSTQLYQKCRQENKYNAQPWSGAIGKKQMVWLKGRLDLATQQQQKVIIFCHFPIVPENALNLWNDNELYTLISTYDCVIAYMNGHNHAGNYGERGGIHFVNFKGLVETSNTNAYAIVRLAPDQITITGFGREPSRTLKLPSMSEKPTV